MSLKQNFNDVTVNSVTMMRMALDLKRRSANGGPLPCRSRFGTHDISGVALRSTGTLDKTFSG
jgi:hypothetical protein